MAFSPLQSRLVASLAATILLAVLYLILFAPNLALAHDVSTLPDLTVAQDEHTANSIVLEPEYQPEFGLLDRGIVGRQEAEVIPLRNNVVASSNLARGVVRCYRFKASSSRNGTNNDSNESEIDAETSDEANARLVRRQTGETTRVWITATTCEQPRQSDEDDNEQTPPQLTLLASFSGDEDWCARSTDDLPESQWIEFEDGLAKLPVDSSEDIYISVMAQNVSDSFEGIWNFDLAASTDQWYHDYTGGALGNPDLLWVDSDSSAALLTTKELTRDSKLTEEYMNAGPPFELYVESDESRVFDGLRRSVCAIKKVAFIEANKDNVGRQHELVRTKMTDRDPDGLPRQQFYFEGLDATTTYNAILFRPMNTSNNLTTRQDNGGVDEGVPGGGGIVHKMANFTTLRGTTCKVVTDLDFCSEVQYAVPGSDKFSNGTDLARKYDDYAKEMYSHFEKIMMQIPCEAEPSSNYSLIQSCDDCKRVYKRWLCTVAVPRCEDYSSDTPASFRRNVGQPFPNGTMLPESEIDKYSSKVYHNSSRNRFIDDEIAPGPYKEILPCEDLCYEVVQSCPASMGFGCPRPGMIAFDATYGTREGNDKELTCNYPGTARTRVSAGATVSPCRSRLGIAILVTLGFLMA